MIPSTPDVRTLFDRAAEITDPADRAAYLDRACAGAPDVRREVDALLRALDQAGGFLAAPALAPAALPADVRADPSATAGALIDDRYRLVRVIGEGGMGEVWLAEQTRPVRRQVALKIIKAGMDSRQVLGRFEAERQALALMDHPNIAKVFDAGTTDTGRPFFVMELVQGVPVTEYCDARQLRMADRLAIFQMVCAAVQHAHQKGIIHRDLKPSNILVETHDGKPVPKVIDFGLAKATSGLPLTDQSLFTQVGTVVGTPLYMAPEQAEVGAIDVDTRADVYALGVVLYELLTGTTPLEKRRLAQAAWDEIRRVIREEDPPAPSARLSTLEAPAATAARRQTEPAKLGRFVRGDLDWIAMKALAKERDRRYGSAAALADDVGRFLRDEPVAAGPPTVGYRVRKFVRRNRRAVTAAAVVAGVLAAGAAGTAWGLVRAREAEQRREADARANAEELRQEKVRRLLDTGYLAAMSGDDATARQAAGEAELAGALGQSAMIRGLIAFYKDNLSEAADELRLAAELLPGSAAVRGMQALIAFTGSLADQQRVLAELVALEPVTPEDYLFKGLGLSVGDAAQGLPLLDEAARRPSPVVWLVRAEARTSYLQQVKPDPDLTVRACQDAVMARQALKDSVPALRTSLRTHLVASRVFQKAGVAFDVRRAAALKEAGDDFAALAPFRSNAEVANLRYFFVRETGTPDQALAEARACVAACPNDPVVAGNLAQQLYLHGQYADAAAVPKVTTWVKILATAEPPGSRDQAHALYLATAGPGQPAWETYNGLLVLAAIGYPAEVAERATALLQRPETFPPLRPEQFNRLVRFLADPRADEAAFLADPTFNRGDQSNARLSVGLRQLARGERDRARAEFQKVIDLGVIDFIPYDIATLLHYQLSRPDQPAWPAWAPAKP